MLKKLKNFILHHEPFKPVHMGHWIRELYFRYYLRRLVPFQRFNHVLDAGCGQGDYLEALSYQYPKVKFTGYDINAFPAWNEYKKGNVSFEKKDLLEMKDKCYFDFIFSVDSIEHIHNNELVLKNFHEALHPHGYLYLAVPCDKAGIYSFPRKWFEDFDEWAHEEHLGEQRNLKELTELIKGLGFMVILARNTFTYWGHLSWEIEFLLRNKKKGQVINILLMPVLKLLGFLDLYLPIGSGDNLVIAVKKP